MVPYNAKDRKKTIIFHKFRMCSQRELLHLPESRGKKAISISSFLAALIYKKLTAVSHSEGPITMMKTDDTLSSPRLRRVISLSSCSECVKRVRTLICKEEHRERELDDREN